MNIGRIISNKENIDTLDFVDVTENIGSIDNFIPTLIIGKKKAEEIYGKENIKVLDKKITNNVSWTFDKVERRNEYERDLKTFNDSLIKTIKKNIKYEFFNIYIEPISRIKKLISFIKSPKIKYIYIFNDHIYMYYKNIVYGISLSDIQYLGIHKNRILRLLNSNSSNIIVENHDFLSKKMRQIIKEDKILIPYLYFLSK
jgi:hypothetical protein